MKEYSIKLPIMLSNLAKAPIRSKIDIIILLLSTIKEYIIADPNDDIRDCINISKICIGKFKRIFFSFDEKIFSLAFPFKVFVKGNGTNSNYCFEYQDVTIDNKLTSILISLFSNDKNFQNIVPKKLDSLVSDVCNEFGIKTEIEIMNIQRIVYYLLTYEDGYFRYDNDFERNDAIYHPQNHFDMYYSNSNTFKIGLKEKINLDWFIKFINNDEPVTYLEIQ